jgi:hypothetical protein
MVDFDCGVEVLAYSRSATAWFEERAGGVVSDVALGTDVGVVLEAMEL